MLCIKIAEVVVQLRPSSDYSFLIIMSAVTLQVLCGLAEAADVLIICIEF